MECGIGRQGYREYGCMYVSVLAKKGKFWVMH